MTTPMTEDRIIHLESMITRATEDLRLALTLYRNEARCAAAESKPLPHRDFWGTLRLNLLELHTAAEELCDEMHPEFSATTSTCIHCGQAIHKEEHDGKVVWVDVTCGDVCGHEGGNEPHEPKNPSEEPWKPWKHVAASSHPALPLNTYILYVRGARGQDVTVWSIEGVSAQINRHAAIQSFGGTHLLDSTYGRGRWKLEFSGLSSHGITAGVATTSLTDTVTENHATWDGCPPGSDTITYHRCDNCSATLTQSQLQPITDLHERLDTDQPIVFPSGQCPLCSALCYPLKE